jgi:cbb3-type cytochrome oxidase maturation protein
MRVSTNNRRDSGVTLVEALAVLAVVGILLGGLATAFVFSLRSYVGQYSDESRQVEALRISSELWDFGTRAFRFAVAPTGGSLSSPSFIGDQVGFYDDVGVLTARFVFVEDPDASTADYREGRLYLVVFDQTYIYGLHLRVPYVEGWAAPFWVDPSGALGYYYFVDSLSGPVVFHGTVYPSSLL